MRFLEVHDVFLVVSARNPRNPFANNQCPSSVYFGTYPIDTQRNDTQVDLLWWTVCGYLFDEDALHSNRGKLFEVFVAKPSNRTFTSDREIRKLSRKRNETKGHTRYRMAGATRARVLVHPAGHARTSYSKASSWCKEPCTKNTHRRTRSHVGNNIPRAVNSLFFRRSAVVSAVLARLLPGHIIRRLHFNPRTYFTIHAPKDRPVDVGGLFSNGLLRKLSKD